MQGRNHGKNLGATSAMVGRICPPGCNRVKVSQILGPTPVDTSLIVQGAIRCKTGKEGIKLAYGSRNKISYTRCAEGVTQCLSLRAGKVCVF